MPGADSQFGDVGRHRKRTCFKIPFILSHAFQISVCFPSTFGLSLNQASTPGRLCGRQTPYPRGHHWDGHSGGTRKPSYGALVPLSSLEPLLYLFFHLEIVVETSLVYFLMLFWGGKIIRVWGVGGAGSREPEATFTGAGSPTERRRV